MSANPYRGVINRIPPGLLRLLGLQQLGRNPEALTGELVPVIEMREWYLISQLEALTSGPQVPAAGPQNFSQTLAPTLVVPQSEWWYVHQFSAQFTNAAAGPVAGRISATATVNGLAFRGPVTTVPAIASARTYATLDRWWAPPGTVFQVTCFLDAAAPANLSVDGNVHFTRLPI
ncbi:MAG TPA: hypothetical protein VFN70_18550 [Burkholderiales bacterium]|nr:hypothetical protein [Burkholderiales bacterium]